MMEEAYNNRALTFLDQGKLDNAIADCDEAIRLKPASPTWPTQIEAGFGG